MFLGSCAVISIHEELHDILEGVSEISVFRSLGHRPFIEQVCADGD
jgi:hypothetical protein